MGTMLRQRTSIPGDEADRISTARSGRVPDDARLALAELDLIYATAPVALCVLDAEGRFLRLNERLAEINGLPVTAHLGRRFAEVLPGVAKEFAAHHRRVMETGEPILGIEIHGETPARPGEKRVWVESLHPIRDETGRVVATNVMVEEVTESRAARRATEDSEARLRLAVQSAGIGVWELDPPTGRVIWSPTMFRLFGLDPDSDPQPDLAAFQDRILHADDHGLIDRALAEAMTTGVLQVEFRAWRQCPEGGRELRWIEARGRLLGTGSERTIRMVGINHDITARRLEQERQALLTRELDHRIRNVLAVVQATVRLTSRADPDRFAEAVEGRVEALARALRVLTESRSEGGTLRALVENELGGFPGLPDGAAEPGRIEVDGPEVRVGAEAVQALSMALHELATNATKYGSLSHQGGRLAVRWTVEGGSLRLEWVECCGPPVASPPARSGFGSRMIGSTLGSQLGGEVAWHWQPGGLRFVAILPIGRILGAGEA